MILSPPSVLEVETTTLSRNNINQSCTNAVPRPSKTDTSTAPLLQSKTSNIDSLLQRHRKKGKAVPLRAWSGPEDSRKLSFPDFVTTTQNGGKFVSLTHRPPLPPGNNPGTHFCQRLSRPQGRSAIGRIMAMKNSLTQAGIESATFRFVAQHLNHCATAQNHRSTPKF